MLVLKDQYVLYVDSVEQQAAKDQQKGRGPTQWQAAQRTSSTMGRRRQENDRQRTDRTSGNRGPAGQQATETRQDIRQQEIR